MNNSERKQCTRCKVRHPLKNFDEKRNGDLTKQCTRCLIKQRELREKRKCEHGKRKELCKFCGGTQLCLHGRVKYQCRECDGVSICKHKKQKSLCRECGGGAYCEHGKVRSCCKVCGGGSLCEHGREKCRCKPCGGSSFCVHGKRKDRCKECGGNGLCQHDRVKSKCRDCLGASFCIHERLKNTCKICDPSGHLRMTVSGRIRKALKSKKSAHTIEYLGCTIKDFKEHIQQQFHPGMSWDNYGDWEIDHIVPIKYKDPSLEEIIERLHYTNTQPLWKEDNNIKNNNHCIGTMYNHNIDGYESC